MFSDLQATLSVHNVRTIQNQRPHPIARLEAIPPKWQSIQIGQAEWSHTSENFEDKFSVIIDEGCHLEVAKMLFPMR